MKRKGGEMIKKIVKCMLVFLFAVFVLGGPGTGSVVEAASEKYVIVLDPGHSGLEAGASATFNGVTYREEVINWKIAKYVQQELSKYPNIEVHMTREAYSPRMSIYDRVKVGFERKADLLVSLHINSADNVSASGACLLISNGKYRPELAQKEKKFGNLLKDEFSKIGLSWRGFLERNSENGSTYPNGAVRDYYGIVASSVEFDIPGVILEHCFITSASDVSKFLSSDAKIQRLAIADAKAIVEYCKEVKQEPKKNGWINLNGKYFYYKDDVLIKNKLLKVSNEIYYVNKDGIRTTGWQTINGKTYYFDPKTGKAQKGWLTLNKKKYYFASGSGVMFQNVLNTSPSVGVKRYFSKDGSLAVNQFVTYGGKTYYMGSNGSAVKGFKKISGKTYYFAEPELAMVKNKKIVLPTGDIYYFDPKGVRVENKFVTIKEGKSNNVYYFGASGIAYKKWHTIKGKKYYFSDAGKMAKDRTLTNAAGRVYVFDKNGVLVKTYTKK